MDTIGDDTSRLERTILLPNLVGLSITEATNILSKLGLIYEIEYDGDYVISQYIPPNTYVYKGALIILTT